jgi:hypothetical protein
MAAAAAILNFEKLLQLIQLLTDLDEILKTD